MGVLVGALIILACQLLYSDDKNIKLYLTLGADWVDCTRAQTGYTAQAVEVADKRVATK